MPISDEREAKSHDKEAAMMGSMGCRETSGGVGEKENLDLNGSLICMALERLEMVTTLLFILSV
jgi:hypothetical protein